MSDVSDGQGVSGNVRVIAPDGIHDSEGRQVHVRDNRPTPPDENMTSAELAEYQQKFTEWSRIRILTDGLKQYDRGGRQAFEDLDFPTLITYAQEELADIVNYCTMLSIKLQRLKEAI